MSKYEMVGIDELETTTQDIKKVLEKLTEILASMANAEMDEAYFPWTKSTKTSIDKLVELPNLMENALTRQIKAKKKGEPNPFDGVKEKSSRDVANRKVKRPKK